MPTGTEFLEVAAFQTETEIHKSYFMAWWEDYSCCYLKFKNVLFQLYFTFLGKSSVVCRETTLTGYNSEIDESKNRSEQSGLEISTVARADEQALRKESGT